MVKVAKIKNNIEFQKEYAVIVGGGKYGGRFIIDLDVVDKINKHKWNLATGGGVQAKVNGKIAYLHRFIMEAEKGDYVTRVSGNKHDFRRECFKLLKAVN